MVVWLQVVFLIGLFFFGFKEISNSLALEDDLGASLNHRNRNGVLELSGGQEAIAFGR